jgi:hypothetical protein
VRRSRTLAIALDTLSVLVFVGIGRSVHDHVVSVAGLASTGWPFLTGLALGWVGAVRLGLVPRRLGAGLVVWVATLVVGMVLRAAAGQGVDAAFVAVAACFLGLFLLGWRVLAWWWRRRRRARAGSSTW